MLGSEAGLSFVSQFHIVSITLRLKGWFWDSWENNWLQNCSGVVTVNVPVPEFHTNITPLFLKKKVVVLLCRTECPWQWFSMLFLWLMQMIKRWDHVDAQQQQKGGSSLEAKVEQKTRRVLYSLNIATRLHFILSSLLPSKPDVIETMGRFLHYHRWSCCRPTTGGDTSFTSFVQMVPGVMFQIYLTSCLSGGEKSPALTLTWLSVNLGCWLQVKLFLMARKIYAHEEEHGFQ